LNEAEAIARTITNCLEASEEIERVAGLDAVEVIVVSDGSTDRTTEIARGFADVKVIVFEGNRGYGAAIQEGFRQGKGSLVGFLDADGTYDPVYFAEMCRIALKEGADIVLGSRMGPGSKMPVIRQIGNHLYALLLGLLCGRKVTDTASGMRVLRRDALDLLYPLPDGLHFTPSMSARALLRGLRVIEIPMRYEERIGTSKLRVLRDGVQFLRAIISGVLCFRPERLFLLGFITCLLLGLLLVMYPLEYYFHHRSLLDWMIYRFVACFLLGASGFLMLGATALAHRMASLGPHVRDGDMFWPSLIARLFEGKPLAAFVVIMAVAFLGMTWRGMIEYMTTAHTSLHWSRLLVGALTLLLILQALITHVLMRVIAIWRHQNDAESARDRRAAESAERMPRSTPVASHPE
jgi:glycosyltransferase involved in cell wall biosynthesis